jgi:signal transduction histidine kinase
VRLISSFDNYRRIAALRVVLTMAAMLASFQIASSSPDIQAAASVYFVYSCILLLLALSGLEPNCRVSLRADVLICSLILVAGYPVSSFLFLLFPFFILMASFIFGQAEGRLITISSLLGYLLSVTYSAEDIPWNALLLRMSFLFGLGFLIAHWGGAEVNVKRQLALLRDVSELSNLRFGVEQTTQNVLEKIRHFFHAELCLAIYMEDGSNEYEIIEAAADKQPVLQARRMPAEVAEVMLGPSPTEVIVYRRTWLKHVACIGWDPATSGKWESKPADLAQCVADSLNACSFISVPLPAQSHKGRLYIASGCNNYAVDQAAFLYEAVQQAFRVLVQIRLMDRLANQAAEDERKRIAANLHDSVIQPYVGLKIGVEAICQKVKADNPVYFEILQLADRTKDVISDLRHNVDQLRRQEDEATIPIVAALEKQAARFREHYGVAVEIDCPEQVLVVDRLARELLQLVAEGLSNVVRHTSVKRCTVGLYKDGSNVCLSIENEYRFATPQQFTPKSIMERAAALCGQASVTQTDGMTRVLVRIPT